MKILLVFLALPCVVFAQTPIMSGGNYQLLTDVIDSSGGNLYFSYITNTTSVR